MSDIVVGSVAVDIVPSTARFRRDLDAKLQGITVDIGVNADTTAVRAQLDDVTRTREVTINANADTAAAEAKLDSAARDRTSRVKANVETEGLAKAVSGFGALTTAAITLGPALIPIAATIGAIGIALAAPIAVAAGGATVFGFITGFAIKQTEEQKKKIDQLAKSVASAKQTLASTKASAATSASNSLASAQASAEASLKSARTALANATTAASRRAAQQRIEAAQASLAARTAAIQRSQSASVAAAQRKVTEAVAAYQGALKALTPAQQRFLDAQDKLKGAFTGLIQTAGPAILGPVTKALTILTAMIPKLTPLINAASGAFNVLLTDLGDAAKGPGFKSFIDTFSKQLVPDIITFGRIGGNVMKGFTGLVFALGDAFGGSVLNGLESLTGKFAAFGQQAQHSKALQNFVDYFHRVGPQVGDTLAAVARAVGHIVQALAPLGPPALKVIEGIANAISSIPVPVLTELAAAFVAMTAASKVGKGLSAVGLLTGGGGRGGVVSSLLGQSKPVHVWVDNPGAGGSAAGGGGSFFNKAFGLALGATVLLGLKEGAHKAAEENFGRPIADLMSIVSTPLTGGVVTPSALKPLTSEKDVEAQNLADLRADLVKAKEIVEKQGAITDAQLKAIGFVNPDQARANFKLPEIKSTTDHFDALKAHAQAASRQIDLIGPHAKTSFGTASDAVRDFKTRLDQIHDKQVRILLDDLAAVQSLKALQAFRLKDKTLTIQVRQELERTVGPGGGMGRPTGAAGGSPQLPPTRSGSGNGAAGPLVNIQHAHISDTNDLLRKSQDALRARAGGGVMLRPPPTARFTE